MIVIVGLGPGDPALLTREAWAVLSRAGTVFLRTRRHPTVAGLPGTVTLRSFDGLYNKAKRFDDIYARIARRILDAARAKVKSRKADVVYAVPGHPLVGERSVSLILEQARAAGIPVRIVSGISFVESVLEALRLDPEAPGVDALDGIQLCDALDLAALHHPPLNPDKPALVAQIYSRRVASDVKLTLLNQYPPEHAVYIVQGAKRTGNRHDRRKRAPSLRGGEDARARFDRAIGPCRSAVRRVALAELDHGARFDHLSTLYVPAAARVSAFEGLQETIAHLRAPDGCPWDREQTHQSLRATLLEEAYEVLTAIDENDMPALREELGDLLLNVILQAQIATDEDYFRMSDVVADIDAKLKRRHPHIFADARVRGSAEVNANWNEIKRQEKAARGVTQRSALDGIAPALPALAQAQKIAHRADRAGFRWRDLRKRFDKILEELEEVRRARSPAQRREELGDLLFTIAYWADGMGIDIESAAREGNLKFMRRFKTLEATIAGRGLDMRAMSEAELLAAWREVKAGRQKAKPQRTNRNADGR